jgi:aquaporin Z
MAEVSKVAMFLAEFVGTYMLILTVGCNVLTGSPIWAVTSIACTLMVMIYALGNISGANFNPAVSLSLAIAGKMDMQQMGYYMACQIAGGVFAGLSYGLALWDVFNLAPTPGFNLFQAGVAEMIYTFMLCFVVLNCCASKDGGNQYFGLAIGFVVVAGGYGAGHISGGCFNPAVALGIDISSAGLGFGWSLAYLIFEFVGAAVAAVLFKIIRAHENVEEGKASTPSMLISEFLGTYMLVLTVGLNVIGGSKAPVFSIAASLMCMIYALGSVSGANFNPAVSLCLQLTNRPKVMDPAKMGMYMAVQLVGGITAGFTYMAMEGGKTFPLAPGKGYTLGQAAFAEIIFTFLLCYVVATVATVEKEPLTQYFGLAIGSCVTAGGYAIGAVSGGSLNPAVSFGISVCHTVNGGSIMNAILYTIFEFIGAAIAAGLFMFTHASDPSLKKTEGGDTTAA